MYGFVYQEIFWLFMIGNVLGVLVEGCWCRFRYGRWQTHVVALWGPFNIVYGLGIAVFYIVDSLLYRQAWPVRAAALALGGCYYVDREGYEAALKAFWNDFD